ncbi:MAG: hypothetical protein R3D70_23655 [Rhizobiaceae bacterium]
MFDDSVTRCHVVTPMSVGNFLVVFLTPLGMAADGRILARNCIASKPKEKK